MSESPGLEDPQSPYYDLNDDAPEEIEDLPRPMGRKQAKARAKAKASGSGSGVDDHNAIGRELVEEIRQFNLVEKEKTNFKILTMDLSKLPRKARKFYEKQKKAIEDAFEISDDEE